MNLMSLGSEESGLRTYDLFRLNRLARLYRLGFGGIYVQTYS